MIVLSLVLAAAAGQAAPAPRLRFLPDWTAKLSGKGWPFLDIDAGNKVVLFAKIDTTEPSPEHLRVLVRHEFRDEQAEPDPKAMRFRSEVISEEVDCAAQSVRTLRDRRYRFSNMEGDQLTYRFVDNDWRRPDPGSFDEEVLQAACMRRPAAAPAS